MKHTRTRLSKPKHVPRPERVALGCPASALAANSLGAPCFLLPTGTDRRPA